jgi:hypothetical protein
MQNRKFVPYLAAMHVIHVLVMRTETNCNRDGFVLHDNIQEALIMRVEETTDGSCAPNQTH